MDGQVSVEQLTRWAESCLRMNHLGTLVQRELDPSSRAADLAERARRRFDGALGLCTAEELARAQSRQREHEHAAVDLPFPRHFHGGNNRRYKGARCKWIYQGLGRTCQTRSNSRLRLLKLASVSEGLSAMVSPTTAVSLNDLWISRRNSAAPRYVAVPER